jgi:hypothetical protein
MYKDEDFKKLIMDILYYLEQGYTMPEVLRGLAKLYESEAHK